MDLSGRRALVTGASRGIGRAIAESLAQRGAHVALLARGDCKETLKACGKKAFAVQADVADRVALEAAIGAAMRRLGGLDLLVSSAGVAWVGLATRASETDWRSMIDVNLVGAMESVRMTLPYLRQSPHGQIILVNSRASRTAFAGGAGYCASKHGLLGFAGALYEELKLLQIKVTTISPGTVATDMTKTLWAGMSRDEMMQAADVADAAMYVMRCSPRACPTEIVLRCHHPIMD